MRPTNNVIEKAALALLEKAQDCLTWRKRNRTMPTNNMKMQRDNTPVRTRRATTRLSLSRLRAHWWMTRSTSRAKRKVFPRRFTNEAQEALPLREHFSRYAARRSIGYWRRGRSKCPAPGAHVSSAVHRKRQHCEAAGAVTA